MATKRNQWNITSAVSIGVALSIILTILLSVLTAIFISNEYFDINIRNVAAIVIQGIAALAGTYLTNRLTHDGKGMASIFCAAAYYVLLLFVSILLFDGISSLFLSGLISCTVGGAIAIMLTNTTKNKYKHKKRTARHR